MNEITDNQDQGLEVPFITPLQIILLRGPGSFVLAGQPILPFPLCIEHPGGEYCMRVGQDDLVAVSAPEGGLLEPALMLLSLVRDYHTPLVVLPRAHPGSLRLRYVVSAGNPIHLSCGIQRGTHPEQHLLCSGHDLGGMILGSRKGALMLHHAPAALEIRRIEASLHMTPGPAHRVP